MTTKQATRKRKPRTPFADCDGKFYVKLKYSGIHWLVAACDGLPHTFFGKEKIAYIEVKEAIAWHQKELDETQGRAGRKDVLDALSHAQELFESGKVMSE